VREFSPSMHKRRRRDGTSIAGQLFFPATHAIRFFWAVVTENLVGRLAGRFREEIDLSRDLTL